MTQSVLDELIGRLDGMPEQQRVAVTEEAVSLTTGMKWIPSPGPQTDAYFSKADVLLYGGQAAGGKTDLLCGLALMEHKRSLIMRRQYTDLGALIERLREIDASWEGFNGSPPPRLRTADGRVIDFGAAAKLGDERHWMGQPHDLLGMDEVVHFLEAQVRLLMGWVRSADEDSGLDHSGLDPALRQRSRTILATNPPVSAEGDYIIGMFRPWLDLTHHNPAKHGELRWYVTDPDGKDFEVDGPEPYQFPGQDKPTLPLSRTFIPANLRDNPFLRDTGYAATLDALPEPLRSAVRDGNFMAARDDDQWQLIPTMWIREAQMRWTPDPPAGVPMCCMAVDPAAGGKDKSTIAMRYDGWFAKIIEKPGVETPMGTEIAGLVVMHRTDQAVVVIDMGGGYGGVPFTTLEANGIEPVAYKGSEASQARTKDRKLGFFNKRTEAWWKLREALDPSQLGGSGVNLPDDQELLSDLASVRFNTVQHRGVMSIKAETKEDVVKRLGRSPDCFVGETLISTPIGGVAIEQLRVGDCVTTPYGTRRIIAVHRRYCGNVLVAVHRGLELLRGRPSHRIFTWEDGWVRLDEVNGRHTLERDTAWSLSAWRLRDLFFTRDRSIGFKQQVDTINHLERMTRRDFFTGGFGLTHMAQLLREFTFTTLMKTGRTATLRIWRRLRKPTIVGCTWKSVFKTLNTENLFCDIWRLAVQRRRNGTGPKKVESGTSNTVRTPGKTESPFQRFVRGAVQNLTRAWARLDFAQLAVCNGQSGILSEQYGQHASSVGSLFLRTSISQERRVPDHVGHGLSRETGEIVYNLTLDSDNVYYANGVLVENCGDAVVMCWSRGDATVLGQIVPRDQRIGMGGRMPKVVTSRDKGRIRKRKR